MFKNMNINPNDCEQFGCDKQYILKLGLQWIELVSGYYEFYVTLYPMISYSIYRAICCV